MNTYKMAWLLAAISIICENIGYYLTFPRMKFLKKDFETRNVNITQRFGTIERYAVWLIVFSLVFVLLMFATTGTSFLAHNRRVAMAAVNPILRYLYPFVQLSAALLGFIGLIQLMFLKEKLKGIITFFLGVLFTMIVYQRGMMVSFVMLAFFVALDFFRINRRIVKEKSILKFLLVILLLFFILVLLRDIYNLIFSGQFILLKIFKESESGENPILLLLASRPDGDVLEVWTILFGYLSENRPLLGRSLINIPFALTSSNFRLSSGYKLGVDILNEHYDYDTYWYRKFGFNLNSIQEMVLNFHVTGILFGFLLGLFRGVLTSWYYRRVFFYGDPTKATLYYQGISYFLSAFNAFHWMCFYVMFAEILSILSKLKLHSKPHSRIKSKEESAT
uniref:Oligosaccharide repeat unit polymerase n=1 Tax=Fervidobacterium pennivorans TaxID=93466 RepID=A0A7C4RXY5_FERPE